MAEIGVTFTPVAAIELTHDTSEDADGFAFDGSTYRQTVAGTAIDALDPEDERTLAQAIAPGEDSIAVTFSADCADAFPSIQYLAPGNPLLSQLIEVIQDASDDSERFVRHTVSRDRGTGRPVVCGWGRDGGLARLLDDGAVTEDRELGVLCSWSDTFLRNREQTTTRSMSEK